MLYAVFLFQFVLVLSSKKRRFLCLESYDLKKKEFYFLFALSWIAFAICWYMIFVNEKVLQHSSGKSGGIVTLIPVSVVFVGQMTTIAILGILRDISHLPRLIRSRLRSSQMVEVDARHEVRHDET